MKTSSLQIKLTTIIAAFVVIAALGCSLCMGQAHAVSAAEKEAEAQDALTQLNAMQATLDEASNEYLTALTDYQQAYDDMNATQARIDEITDEIGEIQDRLGDRARDMYRNGNTTVVDLLLGSASFEEFTQNWDLLNRVNETDAELSSRARELRDEAEEQKAAYAVKAKVADEKAKKANEALERATALVAELQAQYDALSAEAAALYAEEQAAMYAMEGGYMNDDGTVTDIQTGMVYASASEYQALTGNAIVDRARAMIGSSYVWGGVGGSDGGFDCSGLVSYAITGSYTRIGTSYSIGAMYGRVDNPQAGDLYVTDGHIAVYTGEGTLVHAVDYGIGVAETEFREKEGGFFVRPE